MVQYLLIFLEPRQTLDGNFSRWRKAILSGWPEFTPLLYLDANDAITPSNKYRHANLYHVQDNHFPDLPRLDNHLHHLLTSGHLANYDWQLHNQLSSLRRSSLSTATVVTVGMTTPGTEEATKELNEWYDQEHMPGLATVPGWLAGIRTRLAHASAQGGACAAPFLAIHEWEDENGLGGDTWKNVVMTPWTERISALLTVPPYRRVWRVAD